MTKKFNITDIDCNENDGGSIYKGHRTSPDRRLEGIEEHNILFLPLSRDVLFPYMNVGAILEHPDSISTAEKALKGHEPLFFFLASDSLPEDLTMTRLEDVKFSRGAVGFVREIQKNQDGTATVLAQLGPRAVAVDLRRRTPYMRGDVKYILPLRIPLGKGERAKENKLEELYQVITQHLSEEDRKKLFEMRGSIPTQTARHLYFMIQNSPLDADERYNILEYITYGDQRERFIELLEKKKDEMALRAELHCKTVAEMGSRQRDEFLRTQLQQIKNELGETDDSDIDELLKRADSKEWNEDTRQRFDKELRKLQRLNPTTTDYAVQYSYIDTYLDLPWNHCDNSDFTLENVESTLDRDHYGMEKVKERIVEQMAVMKLRRDTKSPILCLYGPPGVGKTSLGKSVAEALGRKYVRVALGGLHDEAEIRGHRRTYLGSMPGRVIAALEKAGTSDPVMVLDEIDKIGADYKGDPAQALLEVLDPEQNCRFHDNYIDQDYDLSKVLFIATANSLNTISSPLLDRMELIEIGGYVEAEKIEITQKIGRAHV